MLILYALIRCKSYLRFVCVCYSRADSTYNALRLEDIASYLNTVFFFFAVTHMIEVKFAS